MEKKNKKSVWSRVCKNDPTTDLGTIIDGLAPDLNKMIESGVVPDSASEIVYNQLDDIKSVGYRVNDVFEAIMLQRHYSKCAQDAKDSTPEGAVEA